MVLFGHRRNAGNHKGCPYEFNDGATRAGCPRSRWSILESPDSHVGPGFFFCGGSRLESKRRIWQNVYAILSSLIYIHAILAYACPGTGTNIPDSQASFFV